MAGFLEGLKVTLKTASRKPVTAQYPEPDKRLDIDERYMGFPALLWDHTVDEPYCTGCMVCIRECPTQCMTATMKDNPLHADGKSKRRKIVDEFEINLGRCIVCGIKPMAGGAWCFILPPPPLSFADSCSTPGHCEAFPRPCG